MAMEAMRRRLVEQNPGDFRFQPTSGPIRGEVERIHVGQTFKSREELTQTRVHIPHIQGIHGTMEDGAYSIVLSGKYEDRDQGDFIIYTGTGGQADGYGNGPQVKDQTFDHPMNGSLCRSKEIGGLVRVIRGSHIGSKYAPVSGYRYDGLYTVTKHYMSKGQSGHQVCLFELKRKPGYPPIPTRW
ncbi:hypothetical protein VKT23_015668 [Stygiomarasmius scandens]|uniref:YDG domain-containing protein n=1 Tax=Marasmiellus scandens TaxID=2682957 RepID=A0ABR1J046_9AGAR